MRDIIIKVVNNAGVVQRRGILLGYFRQGGANMLVLGREGTGAIEFVAATSCRVDNMPSLNQFD